MTPENAKMKLFISFDSIQCAELFDMLHNHFNHKNKKVTKNKKKFSNNKNTVVCQGSWGTIFIVMDLLYTPPEHSVFV